MRYRTATYAGSFDIPTNGHLDIIERAARLFDRLLVLVAYNPKKQGGMFTPEQRLTMLRGMTGHLENVEIACSPETADGSAVLTANWAKRHGSSVLVRAARTGGDFEMERQMSMANAIIDPDIETVFLMTSQDTLCFSSSLIREIMVCADWEPEVSKFVSESVWAYLVQEKGIRPRFTDWVGMWRRLGSVAPAVRLLEEYDRLAEYYAGKYDAPREYHDLKHVFDLLDRLEPYWHLMREPDTVRLAAWYHDAAYLVGCSANEADSADLLKKTVQGLVPKGGYVDFGILACEAVMATADHAPIDFADADYLIDADLATLGLPWPQFESYRVRIRQEYAAVSELDYALGTSAFCQSLLNRQHIYRTPAFREKHEETARENLRRLLDLCQRRAAALADVSEDS